MSQMKTVIIESPYGGNPDQIRRNTAYLWRCIRHSLMLGEAPFSSHMMYPGPLEEALPEERLLGIRAGYAWWPGADQLVFCLDLGWSRGMKSALGKARSEGLQRSFRFLEGAQDQLEARLAELGVEIDASELALMRSRTDVL